MKFKTPQGASSIQAANAKQKIIVLFIGVALFLALGFVGLNFLFSDKGIREQTLTSLDSQNAIVELSKVIADYSQSADIQNYNATLSLVTASDLQQLTEAAQIFPKLKFKPSFNKADAEKVLDKAVVDANVSSVTSKLLSDALNKNIANLMKLQKVSKGPLKVVATAIIANEKALLEDLVDIDIQN